MFTDKKPQIQNNIAEEHSLTEDYSLDNIKKDMLKYAPAKVIGMLMNLMIVPIYTGLLAPEQFGLYMISTGVLSFLAVIFSDWVCLSALRFFREHFNLNSVEKFSSTIIFLICSNLVLMYIFAFVFFGKIQEFFKIPENFLWLVLLVLIPVAFRALLFQILRAQIKPLFYTGYVIVNQFTTILISVIAIKYFNLGPEGILLGMVISISVTDIFMLFTTKTAALSNVKLIKPNILAGLYKYGVPIAAASFGMWIITQSNKFVLQYFKGSLYNGYAGVGYGLTFSLLFPLFAIITLASIPRIINAYEEGFDVKKIISKTSGWFIACFAPFVLVLCLFPEETVLVFSNEKYLNSAALIPFLALSAFFYGLAEYTVLQYHLIKKTYLHTFVRIVPNVLMLGLSILLIPHFEGTAVLVTVGACSLIAQILYFILCLVIKIKDLYWIAPLAIIKKVLVSVICCGAVYFILQNLNPDSFCGNYFVKSSIILITYFCVFKIQDISAVSDVNKTK